MGNPIFRFTLSHEGSENEPITLPDFSLWSTRTGADVEWTEGAIPEVTLPGSFPPTVSSSEYFNVDFSFIVGNIYTITIGYSVAYNSGNSNPRTVTLAILDNSFSVVFSEATAFPVTPGGDDSISITFTADSSCKKVAIKVSSGSNVTISLESKSATEFDPASLSSSLQITEPSGWIDAKLKLERHDDFHSLIEYFVGAFVFYGRNGVDNGGIDYIRGLEQEFGCDVTILMAIELSVDSGKTYEELFNGQLDLSTISELFDNRAQIAIIREDFWSKFMLRKDTPVDLEAATDLDSLAIVDPVDPVNLYLPSQKIRYNGEYNWLDSVTYPDQIDANGMQLDWEETVVDDIKKFNLPRVPIDIGSIGTIATNLIGLFEAPYDGDFRIRSKVTFGDLGVTWTSGHLSVSVYLQKTNQPNVSEDLKFTNTQVIYGAESVTEAVINKTMILKRGDQVAVYGHRLLSSNEITFFGTRRLQWKIDVDVATDQNIVLSGEQTIDGVLTSSSRVLVRVQGAPEENGIYVTAAGAWSRASDADSTPELINAAVYVTAGDSQINSAWRQDQDDFSLGVNANNWVFIIPSDERTRAYPGGLVENYLIIEADSTFKSTNAETFLIHDAAAAILKAYGLGEDNPFYSELLGSSLTNAREYEQDGCAWKYTLLKGLQARGYTLAQKPFFLSFDQWWKGANPILNLGLTYEEIGGTSTDVEETILESVDTWDNGAGSEPGTWDFGSFGYPAISINGSGGPSGYTVGDCITVGESTYQFTTLIEMENTGGATPDIIFTWAILDAGFNEIVTRDFIYSTYGFHLETFTLTPPSGGVYFALKAINNTPIDTKTVFVRYATIGVGEQIILNDEFDNSSFWTNEGAGTLWVITGGQLTISLAAGTSRFFTQEFLGTVAGHYVMITERTLTDITFPTDSLNLVFRFLDEDDNVVDSTFDFGSANNTSPLTYFFTTLVPITKVEIIASINSGAGIDVAIPFFWLYAPTGISDIDVPQEKIIRVEEKEYFYDRTPSLNISNVLDITRDYDNELIFNKIEIGYSQWQSEDISGIDDPQTKHTYATRFKKMGKPIQLHSEFIAASLALETTRRQTIEKSKDYKFDNNTFIVAINPDDVSPDSYRPELDENFSDINGLLNSETRYNTKITPARNLLRWVNFLGGALQSYLNSFYKFVSGEGNYDMSSKMISEGTPDFDCLNESYDEQLLSEKQDIQVTNEYLHLPLLYTININLSWEQYKLILAARRQAIGISQTESDHVPFFIKSLEYEICKSKCSIKAWPLTYFEISQPGFVPGVTEPLVGCGFGEFDRVTSDDEARVTSDGDCRITV